MKNLKLLMIALTNFMLFSLVNVKAFETIEVSSNGNITLNECVSIDGSICKLTSDIVLSNMVEIENNVVIDLNGYSITPKESLSISGGLFSVRHGGTLTINDSRGTGKISSGLSGKVYAGIQLTSKGDTDETKPATLIVNGGTIGGYYYGIVGNGSQGRSNTNVTINGGIIQGLGKTGYAIYQPQDGILTINDGLLYGVTGIEIRSGKLVINDGKIIATGIPVNVESNGNGSTTVGAAVAITQHTTKKNLDVIISGGTIAGYSAVYQSNPEKNEKEAIEKVSIKISGGTFKTLNKGVLSIYSENKEKFITGGTFDTDVSAYKTDDTVIIKTGISQYIAGHKITIAEYTEKEGLIDVSKDSAIPGEEVEVNIQPNEGYIIKSLEVIDADGNEVKINSQKFIMPTNAVTIIGKFEAIKYEQVVETKTIDPTEKVDSITVGVVGDDVTKILLESLKNSEIDVTDKNVTVVVDIENKQLEILDDQVTKITNTLIEKHENAKIAGYFDITLNVIDKDNNDNLGFLTQLGNNIKLSVVLPETLQSIEKGYNRIYYILRNHDDKIEILNAELANDGKSLTFETDRFSTYALAYEDILINNEEVPNTYDGILMYVIIGNLSFIVLIWISLYFKKKLSNL